ncbi:MAG TPA: hypothetical protein VNR51_00670 [Hyphomicrobium sp.]|nr:hypothetical protein [Hyphomicrobium sp.]
MTASIIPFPLKKWFGSRRGSSGDPEYRVFTTMFDEVLGASQLDEMYLRLSAEQKLGIDDAVERFNSLFSGERVDISAAGAALMRDLRSGISSEERAQTVVSLLIDHSGSMRGLRMMSALLACEGAVDALHHAGIATEILGFTTTSWKGGQSRQAWLRAGKPTNPGRLCDLRHVIYGAADRNTLHPAQLRMALYPEMLRENIDGEALIWAAGRLKPSRWTRRVICLVSDGAPVDDSTLATNEDRTLLAQHLEQSQQRLIGEGFIIGSLLIGGEHVREPALHERAEEPREAGLALLRLIRRAIGATRSQPPEPKP